MRDLHRRARLIKQRLGGAPPGEREELTRQLEDLRQRFGTLKGELAQANRVKMIRLGHEP